MAQEARQGEVTARAAAGKKRGAPGDGAGEHAGGAEGTGFGGGPGSEVPKKKRKQLGPKKKKKGE